MKHSWLDSYVSLYRSTTDTVGQRASLRDILFTRFAGEMASIVQLRRLDKAAPDYLQKKSELKSKLQCFTPSAVLESRAKGAVKVVATNGLLQLDFDAKEIGEYDIEELKHAVFSLPCTAFCGLSCSGDGFFALIRIDEPSKLKQYAEHCFEVLTDYGIVPDRTKGKNYQDLRFVSYDQNMLVREFPEPLRMIKSHRKCRKPPVKTIKTDSKLKSGILSSRIISQVQRAAIGNRFTTVQRAAYTLGGLGDDQLLVSLKEQISETPAFEEGRIGFLRVAESCFEAGKVKPLL